MPVEAGNRELRKRARQTEQENETLRRATARLARDVLLERCTRWSGRQQHDPGAPGRRALVPDPPLPLPPIGTGHLHHPHVRGHEEWSLRPRITSRRTATEH